jgi:alkylation response protein AidB-like acyl-CoA dehydrogenase
MASTQNPDTLNQPSPEMMIARATALLPRLRERATRCEQARQLLPETFADFMDADLFKLNQPVRWGGYEYDWDWHCEMIAELARACPSSAWVYGVLNDHQSFVGLYPLEAQHDIWGDNRKALVSSSYMPNGKAQPVDGGFKLSGHWKFSSGCDYAQWAVLGGMVPDADGAGQTAYNFLVPMRDYRLIDTWFVTGLQGTGSKDLVIDDCFVPAHRALPSSMCNDGTTPGGALTDQPVCKRQFASSSCYTIAAAGVGAAQGALDLFIDSIRGRSSRGGTKIAELPTQQLRLADAAIEVDCSYMLMRRSMRETTEILRRGDKPDIETRARNRRDAAYSVLLATRAVDRLQAGLGGAAINIDHPMQRYFRDIHAIAAHLYTSWDMAGIIYGRIKLGFDPGNPVV